MLGLDSTLWEEPQEQGRNEGGAWQCGSNSSNSGSCGMVDAGGAGGVERLRAMLDRASLMLDVGMCPRLALTALDCSRAIMASSSPSSAAARGDEGIVGIAGAGDSIPTGRALAGDGNTKGSKQGAGRGSCSSSGPGAGGRRGRDSGAVGGGAGKGEAAWLGGGGPLARRWWLAAVAAVHCRLDSLDNAAAEGDSSGGALAVSMGVLGLYPYLPAPDQGGLAKPCAVVLHCSTLYDSTPYRTPTRACLHADTCALRCPPKAMHLCTSTYAYHVVSTR